MADEPTPEKNQSTTQTNLQNSDSSHGRTPRLRDLPNGLKLGPVARAVLSNFCLEHANGNPAKWPAWVRAAMKGRDGFVVWPSVATISRETEYSERAVQVAIRKLEKTHAIQCIYRYKGGGSRPRSGPQRIGPICTSIYILTPHLVRSEAAANFGTSVPATELKTGQLCETHPARIAESHPAPPAPKRASKEFKEQELASMGTRANGSLQARNRER